MPGFPIDDDWPLYDPTPRARRDRRRRLQLLAAVLVVGFVLGRWSDDGHSGGQWASALHAAAVGEQEDLSDELVGPCEATRVIDGDTVDINCGAARDRVRLLRIDTPERGQLGHREAQQALQEMLEGEEIHLGFENEGRLDRGRYGRVLAYVYADDRNVNVEMVRQGWSEFWTKYGVGRLANTFTEAELEARTRRSGLWDASY